ncbi:Hypothetical predicted protein [Marmota monax]|uniref:Uncharacterized protein n=1 Tax=Marmota monax TaxID=9995 RepID=A0A5E4ARW1_MARMO|nr:Hypothetical predicted protein [Marmota monax]
MTGYWAQTPDTPTPHRVRNRNHRLRPAAVSLLPGRDRCGLSRGGQRNKARRGPRGLRLQRGGRAAGALTARASPAPPQPLRLWGPSRQAPESGCRRGTRAGPACSSVKWGLRTPCRGWRRDFTGALGVELSKVTSK